MARKKRKRRRRGFWPFMIVVILFSSPFGSSFSLSTAGEGGCPHLPPPFSLFRGPTPPRALGSKRGPLAPKSESRKFDKKFCWKHLLQLPGPNLPTSLSNVKKIEMGGESGDFPPLLPWTISGRQIGGSCGGGGGVMIGGAGRGNFLLGGGRQPHEMRRTFRGGYVSGGVWAVK